MFNKKIVILSVVMIILGFFNGTLAYQKEVDMILNYKTDYSMFTKFLPLFIYLVFRYFKYILLIQFFVVGYYGKVFIPIISMYKSYIYGFVLSLIICNFDGLILFKKLGVVSVQMTLSLLITLFFSCVSLSYVESRFNAVDKNKIQFLAFVFSLFCCIIISLLDYVIIINT